MAEEDTGERPGVTTRWWFLFFAAWLVTLSVVSAIIISSHPPTLDFSDWESFKKSVETTVPSLKLIIIALYMSLACTFTMLNTSWLMAAVAIAPGLTGEFYSTVIMVSVAGAIGTTVANLNDYHIFTLMLKSERIARIRNNSKYAAGERWFGKYPFGIIVFFNIFPIPVDLARPLAASYRYHRGKFAVANFTGRLTRYIIIAGVTYKMGEAGWIAPVVLISVAIIMVLVNLVLKLVKSKRDVTGD